MGLVVGNTHSPLRKHLNKETIRRIEEKARELGYRPNRAAQVVRRGRTNLLAHLNCSGFSELAGQTSYHIGRLVLEAGFDYQMINSYWWPGAGDSVIERILSLHPEGVIVSGALQMEIDFKKFRQVGIPVVGVGLEIPGFTWVRYNARAAIEEITRHCLQLGRKPAILLHNLNNWQSWERRRGFMDALAAANLKPVVECSVEPRGKATLSYPAVLYAGAGGHRKGIFDFGADAARFLLEVDQLPRALICTNDNYAIGAITVLQRAGVRIPEDVAVSGFDNVGYCTQGPVTLTSVEQPVEKSCHEAVTLLKKQIGKPLPRNEEGREYVQPCRIHWRESMPHNPEGEQQLQCATFREGEARQRP